MTTIQQTLKLCEYVAVLRAGECVNYDRLTEYEKRSIRTLLGDDAFLLSTVVIDGVTYWHLI